MTENSIEREVRIEAPVQRVWEVLTGPTHMPEWFSGATASGDLRPGGTMVFHWKQHGSFQATIERVEPPRAFAFRWALVPDEAPDAGNSTRVEFTLTADGEATRLRVLETGFETLAGDQARHLKENRQGWAAALSGIQTYASRREAASGG